MKKYMLVALVVGLTASVAPAAFLGTIDFEDGTQGPLTKLINLQFPSATWTVDSGVGFNPSMGLVASNPTNFSSDWLVVDSAGDGTGDVYDDVTVSTKYQPGVASGYECALGVRINEGNGDNGWGLWTGAGTNGWGAISITFQHDDHSSMSMRQANTIWANGDGIAMTIGTWYDTELTADGTLLTGTVTELDANGDPVAGHTATVSYDMAGDPDVIMQGFVGTRSAGNGDSQFILDNYTVTPEPATMLLLGLGGALSMLRRKK